MKMGDRFEMGGNEYILAQTDPHMMQMICLEDGNRWDNAVYVKDLYNVTDEEVRDMTASSEHDWFPLEQ